MVTVFPDCESLFQSAANEFVDAAQSAIGSGGPFRVVLTGGNTPKRLYEILASAKKTAIDWRRVEFFWSDERAVPPNHTDSNFRMAGEHLLLPLRIHPTQVYRMQAERSDLDSAAQDYQSEIARSFGLSDQPSSIAPPRFDLLLLGMGDDGHIASLFPETDALAESSRWVVANHVPRLNTDRMTLTFPIINRARQILFLVTGIGKAKSLASVFHRCASVNPPPAASVCPDAGSMKWFVDLEAASFLDKTNRDEDDVGRQAD